MDLTYFILNGPRAGYLLPYSNAIVLQEKLANGRTLNYVPAPAEMCAALGPCVLLAGSKISRMASGNFVIAHPQWVRTLMNPRTGEIRECEFDVAGAGMEVA